MLFGLLASAVALSLLRIRCWTRKQIIAGYETIDFVNRSGKVQGFPWASIESVRFHRFSIVPSFSIHGNERAAARVYLSLDNIDELLQILAMRATAAKPTLTLPTSFQRRSWWGAAWRLTAALAPVAGITIFLGQRGAEIAAWTFAVGGIVCAAGYVGVLCISPLSTEIDRRGILVKRRFKGDINLRLNDIESIQLGLPFGKAAGGPRVTIHPRHGRMVFLSVPADRSLALYCALRLALRDCCHLGAPS